MYAFYLFTCFCFVSVLPSEKIFCLFPTFFESVFFYVFLFFSQKYFLFFCYPFLTLCFSPSSLFHLHLPFFLPSFYLFTIQDMSGRPIRRTMK